MPAKFDVFLSYSSVDQPWVIKLKDDLLHYGVSVWLDKDEIRPGDLFAATLESALDNCRTVALIVSPEAISSGWVKEEYYRTLSLGKASQTSVQIIPVLLREAELPGFLQSRNCVDFRDETAYTQSVWKLVWGITGVRPAQVLALSALDSSPDLPRKSPTLPKTISRILSSPVWGGIGTIVAILACIGTILVIPQVQNLFQLANTTPTSISISAATPTHTPTAVPVPTNTSTPTPTNTPTPTEPPTPTPTTPMPTPTHTPTPVTPQIVSSTTVNIRSGPGTNYPIIGSLPPNTPLLPVIGRNETGSWWQVQLDEGEAGWVSDEVVEARGTDAVPIVPIPIPPCPYQAQTDMETIDRLIQAEGEAVVREDISLIRAIFVPDAIIRRGDTGEQWNNPVTYYTNLFSALDFTQATHYGIQPAGPGITESVAYFTSGSRITYGPTGATPVFQDNPPTPPASPSTQYGSEHWTLQKNRAGCWQITELVFNADHISFPPGTSFQDFEPDNGTPPGSGNYFWDAWLTTCSFSESPVYEGRRAVRCDAHVEATGNPSDHGGTMGINPASSNPINLSAATTISVWVYDTQGNNTVELKLRDKSEAVSNKVWSTMQTKGQWAEITWPLAEFTGVDKSQIKNLELYMWNDGVYYFDAVTWR